MLHLYILGQHPLMFCYWVYLFPFLANLKFQRLRFKVTVLFLDFVVKLRVFCKDKQFADRDEGIFALHRCDLVEIECIWCILLGNPELSVELRHILLCSLFQQK